MWRKILAVIIGGTAGLILGFMLFLIFETLYAFFCGQLIGIILALIIYQRTTGETITTTEIATDSILGLAGGFIGAIIAMKLFLPKNDFPLIEAIIGLYLGMILGTIIGIVNFNKKRSRSEADTTQ